MNAKHLVILGLCVSALAACNKQSSEPQPADSAAAAAPLTDEALDTAQIPVKEDFEEQAAQAVTEENVDELVSQLEKEIQEDK